MTKIAIYNLPGQGMEDDEKINVIARTVIKEILSIPGTGLKEEDISFTFHRNSLRKSGEVSVIITEASFFRGKMNSQVRQIVRRRVIGALALVLQQKAGDISVEIER